MPPALLNVGYGNYVASEKIVAVVEPDSAPIKRVISDGKKRGVVIDATAGHKTRSVLALSSGHLILSAHTPETVAEKMNNGGLK